MSNGAAEPTEEKVRERPIIMSGSMVRQTMADKKTCTRRFAVIHEPTDLAGEYVHATGTDEETHWLMRKEPFGGLCLGPCRYGKPGDLLWVKETWRPFGYGWSVNVHYAADGVERLIDDGDVIDWTMPKAAERGNVSPLYMPRWASRILLEVTEVRVERLQAITADEARAEGLPLPDLLPAKINGERGQVMFFDPLLQFRWLWDHLNGKKPGRAWADNPWTWVVGFRRLETEEQEQT